MDEMVFAAEGVFVRLIAFCEIDTVERIVLNGIANKFVHGHNAGRITTVGIGGAYCHHHSLPGVGVQPIIEECHECVAILYGKEPSGGAGGKRESAGRL